MKRDLYAGVDPGKTGAVGFVDVNGAFVAVHDCPDTEDGCSDLMREYGDRVIMATFEKPTAWAGVSQRQGIASTMKFGMGYGIWKGIFACFRIPREEITAAKWQKIKSPMPKPKDTKERKQQSRDKARQLFPDAPITLKKHEGRAEALLIAEFGRREHLGLGTSGGKRRRR
jgi:hypothetical protein